MTTVNSIGAVLWVYRRKLLSGAIFLLVFSAYFASRPFLNECAPEMTGKGIGAKVIACATHYFSDHK
jgi:hypothetical protein